MRRLEPHYIYLLVQRAALLRAIKRAREHGAEEDAAILQTIAVLLEEIYETRNDRTDLH
jgi:hypothetical protein